MGFGAWNADQIHATQEDDDQGQPDYEELSPNLLRRIKQNVLKRDGSKRWTSLKLQSEHVSKVTNTLIYDRDLEARQARLTADRETLAAAMSKLNDRINTFCVRIEQLTMQDTACDSDEMERLRVAAIESQSTRGRLKNGLQDIEKELEELSEERENRMAEFGSAEHNTAAKSAVDDLDAPKVQAVRKYQFYKLVLGQAKADFDTRQKEFDQERDQLLLRCKEDETRESIYKLEGTQILETRRLAQKLSKAEVDFRAAKDEAVGAGVVFGSDASSDLAS